MAELLSTLLVYMKKWFLYILFCDRKTFYVGMTDNLERRIYQHKQKQSLFTKKFSTIELTYFEQYLTRKEAEKREKQIKGWSIAKKKALIQGNKELLIKLSKATGPVEA